MAIPTEIEFTRCLAKIDEYPFDVIGFSDRNPCYGWEVATVDGFSVDNNFNNFKCRNMEACEEALIFVWEKLADRRRDIFDSEVMRWLLTSSEYLRVYNKLFPNGFRTVPESDVTRLRSEFVDWAFDRLCRAANGQGRLTGYTRYIFERRRIFSDQHDSFRWIRALISAVREYHYSNTAEQMSERKKAYKNRILKAIDGIRSLRSLVSDDIAMEVARVMCDGRDLFIRFKGNRFDEEKVVQCLTDMMEIDPDALYPISRLDSTARARVFVYRMAEANWRQFRSHKPAQIADLMYLDGFDVQLDQRTIQRQCTSLASMDRVYWTQVQGTASGAAYLERRRQWRQSINKKK